MSPSQPSRRQLLTGLLLGLFGWLRPGRAAARHTPPPLARLPHPLLDPFATGTISTYDAAGCCLCERGPLRLPALPPVPLPQPLRG